MSQEEKELIEQFNKLSHKFNKSAYHTIENLDAYDAEGNMWRFEELQYYMDELQTISNKLMEYSE